MADPFVRAPISRGTSRHRTRSKFAATFESPTNRQRTHLALDDTTDGVSKLVKMFDSAINHRQPLRPARPCWIRHQISIKPRERSQRSSRKNDRPAKTTNTSIRPSTHRQAQLSQRTTTITRWPPSDHPFKSDAIGHSRASSG